MASRLTYKSIPTEIKQIANESLGLGILRSLFTSSNTYHLMIKISDGEFIGFSLYHFKSTRMKDGSTHTTGVIDCICVATPYRKAGFGTLLTFGTLRKMSAYGADRVEMVLKTPRGDQRDGDPGVPAIGSQKVLEGMGFKKVKVFDDYFSLQSQKYAYDCNFCGDAPDSCRGILYSINS